MIRTHVRLALAISTALVVPQARGQSTAALPKAETVFAQYVEATGGRAAYEKFKNRISTGSFEIVGANLKGKVTLIQAAPGQLSMTTDLGPLGKTRSGTDGKLAWEVSTIGGERLLEGDEKEAMASQALFNAEIRWSERGEKAECVSIEDVEGKPAAKVVLTRKSGKTLVEYYDLASHLLVKQTITTKGPSGELVVDQFPGDYRREDGVLMPHSTKQKVLGQEMVLRFDEIKHNTDLAADTFAVPAEIVSLQKSRKK
jgi:hypothetical protein